VDKHLERIEAEALKYGRIATTREAQAQLRQWKRRHRHRLLTVAREETIRTIRHEGAHQIFYDLHVHGRSPDTPHWVIEGLATFCETDPLGARHNPSRAGVLRAARRNGKLIPLRRLTRSRCETPLQYSECWALTVFLMHSDRYRRGFFEYLRCLGSGDGEGAARRKASLDELCRCLRMPPRELEKQWQEYVGSI
jgi:hypothetical protein